MVSHNCKFTLWFLGVIDGCFCFWLFKILCGLCKRLEPFQLWQSCGVCLAFCPLGNAVAWSKCYHWRLTLYLLVANRYACSVPLCPSFRFVNSLVYYGLSLNVTNFGLDIYLTQLAFGAVEIPARIGCIFLLQWLGRKKTQAVLLLLSGLVCLIITGIPEGEQPLPMLRGQPLGQGGTEPQPFPCWWSSCPPNQAGLPLPGLELTLVPWPQVTWLFPQGPFRSASYCLLV